VDETRGKAVEQENQNFSFKLCDVSSDDAVRRVVHGVRDEYGRIDAVVNNAGIIRRRAGEEISVSDWDEVFAINTRGAFLFCKYTSAIMKAQKSGRIVNVSSIAGKLGDITSAPGYGPSKAAMDALTKTFARELAPYGVTVNGVAPHAIRTEMSAEWSEEKRQEIIKAIPLLRLGEPREVAAAVTFLLSADAGFITGEIIDVNGGMIMD
jgi:3-oxoacyl-[acyl-carrier protein] reductase